MGLTLGITGMDRATEAQLRAAFEEVSPRIGGRWRLANEAEADYVLVDMDSMYGPMSWIRLHAAGKQVIALTTSARTQADHLLAQPFDASSLSELLQAIGGAATGVEDTATEIPARVAEPTASPAPSAGPTPPAPSASLPTDTPQSTATASPSPPAAHAPAAPPSATTPAPAPADALPEERVLPVDEESAPPPEPAATLEPAPPAAAAAAPHEATLADWVAPGALAGRWRYDRDGVAFVFDADARTYHGSATLKPLAPAFARPLPREELAALDPSAWAEATAKLGAAQPLSRLQWLGGLLAGGGALLPGLDPAGRYRLAKWPQTEREYPKHFRLATAMMKGPTTVSALAAASGVTDAEAADFVNANLATGYAEVVPDQAAEPVEAPKSGGLFGRIRGR